MFVCSSLSGGLGLATHSGLFASRPFRVSFDLREIQLSIAAARLEKIGHHMRLGATGLWMVREYGGAGFGGYGV